MFSVEFSVFPKPKAIRRPPPTSYFMRHQVTNLRNAYIFGFKIKIVLLTLIFTLFHSEGNFGKRLSSSQSFEMCVCMCEKMSEKDKYSNKRKSEKNRLVMHTVNHLITFHLPSLDSLHLCSK